MKFFTYDYNMPEKYNWPYLIVKLTNYFKLKKPEFYKYVFIDPGVYDLIESDRYDWEGMIDVRKFLNDLPKNHFFSFDYPGDMNPEFQDRFLTRSWDNAIQYCGHPQYIVTVQYKFNDYYDFIQWFDKYNELNIESGIMGVGNICKQLGCNQFLKHALPHVFKNSKAEWIHVYGANKATIPYIRRLARKFNKKASVDNRKWEYYKPSNERPFWFRKYMNALGIQNDYVDGGED